MRGKLTAIFIAFLAISPLYQPCKAQIVEIIGFASSIATLEQFIEVMYARAFKSHEPANEVLLAVDKMNNDVNYQLGEISKSLEELPSIIDHVGKRNKLQGHVNNIGFVFKKSVQMQKDIDAGSREDKSTYINFRKELEHVIDKDIDEIQRMLLDSTTTSYLTTTMTEGLRLYENVCKSGRTHMQLLDSLLAKLKRATAYYYIIKNKMYDFVQPYRPNPDAFDTARNNLRNKVKNDYNNAVREFKKIMATASRELWKCDAPKTAITTRYQNDKDGPYYELMAFTKYIMNEAVFGRKPLACEKLKCYGISHKRVDSCGSLTDELSLCGETRKCPNNLVGCNSLHWSPYQESSICIKDDTSSHSRYSGLVPAAKASDFSCRSGRLETVSDTRYGGQVQGRWSIAPITWCKFCQCTCPETTYYINTELQWNAIGSSLLRNRVVTGARLVVEDNTIFVQIQFGTLMANGTIDANSVDWERLTKGRREEISWEGIRSIDLTSIELPTDKVMTGMRFQKNPADANRIQLVLISSQYNFKTGRLSEAALEDNKKYPHNELNLSDATVPTNVDGPNAPDSNEEQYVKFTTSSMEKDGGQTTIPFIDTQMIVTNPPSPISGAGLYHRGRPGYGGFLALKLYTYNFLEHIKEDTEIPTLADL